MIRRLLAISLFAVAATCSHAQPSLPSSFRAKTIHSPEGADIFVRWGGNGPVVVLIHGYAENSDSCAPLAADLMKDHTVVVPDLRGIGKSSKTEGGYDKKTQAKDIRAVVTGLGYDKTFVVAHDIGNMVAYAYAATYPDKVERLVVMDAPIPGIEPWKEILLSPGVWHFNFHGPDAERLVAGRERIYFDRIWNDFTGDPSKPDEATRNFFAATYAQPGGMRAGFAQFTAFSQDAKDNEIFERVKLTMPVLAVGGDHAERCDQCSRGGGDGLRALADGRAPSGNRGAYSQFPRFAASCCNNQRGRHVEGSWREASHPCRVRVPTAR
jgi:pimeloyl-ACP methyl ester carboxylesterase